MPNLWWSISINFDSKSFKNQLANRGQRGEHIARPSIFYVQNLFKNVPTNETTDIIIMD